MSNGHQVLFKLAEECSDHFDAPQQSVKAAASYSFSKDFMEKLKEDELTLEMLEELSTVSVFKHPQQLAIHGRFPKKQVDEVMNYRYGIDMQSNLLLLRYDQIDINKKKMLNEWLQFVSTHKKNCSVPTLFEEDGNLVFQFAAISSQAVNQMYDRIDTSLFYGKKEMFRLSDPSRTLGTFHILSISIGAMNEENMWSIFENWTGMTEKQYDTLKKKVGKDQLKELQELEKEEHEIKERCEEHYNAAIGALEHLPEWGGKFNNNIVLVTGLKDKDSVGFQFMKLQTGKHEQITTYSQSTSELEFDVERYLRTKSYTQEELSKILEGGTWFVYDVGDRILQKKDSTLQSNKKEEAAPVETAPFELVYYSDKSAALFGDTRPYKDILNKDPYRGVYNYSLTHPEKNEKVKGWLFTLDPKRIEAVEKLFSIKLRKPNQKIAA